MEKPNVVPHEGISAALSISWTINMSLFFVSFSKTMSLIIRISLGRVTPSWACCCGRPDWTWPPWTLVVMVKAVSSYHSEVYFYPVLFHSLPPLGFHELGARTEWRKSARVLFVCRRQRESVWSAFFQDPLGQEGSSRPTTPPRPTERRWTQQVGLSR